MKQLLSFLLVLALALSMIFVLAACGDEPKETDGTTTTTAGENQDENLFPEALNALPNNAVPDYLMPSGWEFAGGMIDGVEMEQEDVDAILQATGGTFQVVFSAEGVANLVNGEQVIAGTYEKTSDTELFLDFGDYSYYARFTTLGDDTEAMLMVNPAQADTVFYMILMSET